MPRGVRKNASLLNEFARVGAESRVRELETEIEKLYRQIQDIRNAVPGLRLKRRFGTSGREMNESQAQEFAASIKKEKMSADERERLMSALLPTQQKRVRELLGTSTKPARKRRKMSAKARAAISAAQKARWAKQKAGKK